MQNNTAAPLEQQKRLLLPDAPVLIAAAKDFALLTRDGELQTVPLHTAQRIAQNEAPIVCHRPQLAARLGFEQFTAYDVLELFAFVHPVTFCAPTPRGLARALHLMEAESAEDQCLALQDIIRHLLTDLSAPTREEKSDPAAIAAFMGLMLRANDAAPQGWLWTPVVLAALGRDSPPPDARDMHRALKIWDKLPKWSAHAPPPPPAHHDVSPDEAKDRLHRLLARRKREERTAQQDYAAAVAKSFSPCDHEDDIHVVLAEAGTGVGKTLGYLAPATVWAEKNEAAVWVSTYTRALQTQADAELEDLYDDPVTKSMKVVTRKGRENYLCLLNLEDIIQSPAAQTSALNAVTAGLMLRWAAESPDGDMTGKSFPGWLPGILGRSRIGSFADKRGECIYAACPHFDKCFVEKSVRKARRADIVISNHALVMHQTAIGADDTLPTRYIFDEGHHLFDAADNAFGAHLNGMEAADLRRWILGTETGRKTRARGLKRRIEDLIDNDDKAKNDLDAVLEAARSLPGPAWRARLSEGAPRGVCENFLLLCRQQVLARNTHTQHGYSLETPVTPPIEGLFESAYALSLRLKDLQRPMLMLARRLQASVEDDTDTLDMDTKNRMRFVIQSLTRRGKNILGGWIDMLDQLVTPTEELDGLSVDWLELTRSEGIEHDMGLYRHYIDPVKVFASALKPYAHGVTVTSASLRDADERRDETWTATLPRTGAPSLDTQGQMTHTFHAASPFDYARQTHVIVVRDVDKKNPAEVANAMAALFAAANGGALGLFTAIQRLKAVHKKLFEVLAAHDLPLYAQHIDPLATGTLVDIFREEENACLLGTDATRDGMDIPGESLRLVVYDRVPWPRPTLLHKARRQHFGKDYDDRIARARLQQAYGRLIRRADDKGVFVMLDAALPTRLCSAFPESVEIERVDLKDATDILKEFL